MTSDQSFGYQVFFTFTSKGQIPDFKLGGAHLKKLRRAERDAKIVGVFRVKNHDFTPKNHIFSNFRGGGHALGAAPLDLPLQVKSLENIKLTLLHVHV